MSSREIAELTGKRHADVMRDIRSVFSQLDLAERNFASSYVDGSSKSNVCFNLPKRESLILVSGYSVELRARIIDRWQELEQWASSVKVPNLDSIGRAESTRARCFRKSVAAVKERLHCRPIAAVGEQGVL